MILHINCVQFCAKTPKKSIYMGLAYYKHDYFLICFFQE